MGVDIRMISRDDEGAVRACAQLLVDCFEHSWDTLEEGISTVREVLQEGIVFVAAQDGEVMGFVGALPQYEPYGWELHPLAVAACARRRGIGSALVAALEEEVRARGGIVMYLGADDEGGETSLGGVDLFDGTFARIAAIEQRGNHPFQFYESCGYSIVGVLPDVNGWGKPDIYMAKRLVERPEA